MTCRRDLRINIENLFIQYTIQAFIALPMQIKKIIKSHKNIHYKMS